jgi:hypothetical protein
VKVIEGDPTPLFRAADDTLVAAMGKLEHVVVIGYTRDGEEYFGSSMDDGPRAVWHLERAKLKLLNIGHVEDA